MRIEINPNPQFILMNEWGKINNKRKKKKRKEREREKRDRERVEERLRWAISVCVIITRV